MFILSMKYLEILEFNNMHILCFKYPFSISAYFLKSVFPLTPNSDVIFEHELRSNCGLKNCSVVVVVVVVVFAVFQYFFFK